jgi:FkbM family methyltransferase
MDADNARLCEQNTAFARDRVRVVNAAIWSSDGVVEYDGDDVNELRVTTLDAATVAPATARRARATSVPTLFAEHGITAVDFMKMDIEGAEAAVLGADVSWLAAVRAILIEVHPPATVSGCRDVLDRHGFRVSQFQLDHPTLFGVRDGTVRSGR